MRGDVGSVLYLNLDDDGALDRLATAIDGQQCDVEVWAGSGVGLPREERSSRPLHLVTLRDRQPADETRPAGLAARGGVGFRTRLLILAW